jgi:hypothetical protein
VLKKIAVLWDVKLYCWESIVPSDLKCFTAFIFSAIYPSPSHFYWLSTHSCRPVPALTLAGQRTVFLHRSSLFTAFLWRWRHGDLQNVWDYLPTNAASHPRNWNLKFQLLEKVIHLINVLTLWCVCWWYLLCTVMLEMLVANYGLCYAAPI